MEFRISDTFTDSLAKLAGEEQKVVKTTAFDLQMNPANPGMQFHRIERAKDKHFWSVRAGRDLRVIVHKTDASILLCYVGHHDDAYNWASKRKLQVHPTTGAAQLVEVRELVKEITIPTYVEERPPAETESPLFPNVTEETLLGYGVPPDWVDDVHQATESSFFALAHHLPSEAAEALLELATGCTPTISPTVQPGGSPFDHPDAQRRFRVMQNVEELEQALNYPWEKWAVFLHPAQRDLVDRAFNGPARVAGSAGTGKTVVALHRAAYLARKHPTARLLLTTFSDTLAKLLRLKIRRLAASEPGALERIEVYAIEETGRRLYATRFQEPAIADQHELRRLLFEASNEAEKHRFSERFLWTEWNDVVDAWQLDSWEAYRDVPRLGRKTRLGEAQRLLLWGIFEKVRSRLVSRNLLTRSGMFARLTQKLEEDGASPYDFAVVDEAQDIGVPELRFLAALGKSRPDSLFFAGDLGQRIFQPPFSWKSLGVDVRGRSRTLRINYRTSHQIRLQADRLLPPEMSDVDGNTEDRRGTVSAFNGPAPVIQVLDTGEQESQAVAEWLKWITKESVQPHEIGVFVRSEQQFGRARTAVESAGYDCVELHSSPETESGGVAIMSMHLAKGLEFRAVVVMACDDEVIPLQERIAAVADDVDLEEVYNTERHLLYVACTRARDHLLVTGVDPASEFLDDLNEK